MKGTLQKKAVTVQASLSVNSLRSRSTLNNRPETDILNLRHAQSQLSLATKSNASISEHNRSVLEKIQEAPFKTHDIASEVLNKQK